MGDYVQTMEKGVQDIGVNCVALYRLSRERVQDVGKHVPDIGKHVQDIRETCAQCRE